MSGKINSQLFSAHEHALDKEPCPQCGGELSLRHGKHGPFLGCSQYPSCDYIRALGQNDGHIVKELGVPCPICSSELVLRQGRYGMFIGCSAYPECHHIESLDPPKEELKAEEEIACPECKNGHLIERKSRFGKMFYACNGYPKCKFAVNHKPLLGECDECDYPLLVEKTLASGVKILCANRKCQKEQIQ
ncbi:DNA topoisomerase [Vibrio sp. S9_S30]|uniref:DNA topoisomerase family protein n=1 Tax=Vibrio sp. S9_S30 TaxID=2720226 RepID=UPI0016800145|nr:topoisomerase DNA-binding C4 zinc finger domain-containing protein [Vibrio sp. S9_S30]MBD1559169.1 DNA topoisomerase [Vibrio sp. S9_S30]